MNNLSPCAVKQYLEQIKILGKQQFSVMEALHICQNQFGFIPMEICELISKEFNVPMSVISGIVSFYSRFTTTPPGKIKIDVCTGTACFVKGANNLYSTIKSQLNIGENGLSPDAVFSLSSARCFGCCSLAPVITVDGESYGNMTNEKLNTLLIQLKQRGKI